MSRETLIQREEREERERKERTRKNTREEEDRKRRERDSFNEIFTTVIVPASMPGMFGD
jgi:hypothetical protein